MMDTQYKIKSNRESGDGRYDICLIPKKEQYPGVIMELKAETGLSENELNDLAEKAIQQMEEKRYGAELVNDGVSTIIKLGIAFSGKKVKVKIS